MYHILYFKKLSKRTLSPQGNLVLMRKSVLNIKLVSCFFKSSLVKPEPPYLEILAGLEEGIPVVKSDSRPIPADHSLPWDTSEHDSREAEEVA